jgi:glycosyltransferase involved in cell wall biosynthesis
VRDRGREILLEYVGASKEELAALPGVGTKLIESLGAGIQFGGRLQGPEVYAALRRADFGVLFRDDARWSRACFPSKVPELLALGVPMLCNLTSDLGQYLTHGHNAIIANELSVDGFTAALEQALKLDAQAMAAIKHNARRTAQRFDASRFADVLRNFLRGENSPNRPGIAH